MHTKTLAFLDSRSNSDLKRTIALEVNRLFAVYRRETGAEPMAGGAQNIILRKERDATATTDTDDDLFQFSLEDCGKAKSGCASFCTLPVSVQLRILAHLEPTELCACSTVCRRWYRLAGDEVIWRRLLRRRARLWRRVEHDRNPHFYRQVCPDMSSREIYLRCHPFGSMSGDGSASLSPSPSSALQAVQQMLSGALVGRPRLVMFGPGLETATSKLVRSILTDQHMKELSGGSKFHVTGMVPGQFAGIGSGISIRLGDQAFNLVTLYSNVKSVRQQLTAENRVTESKLFIRQPNSGASGSSSQPVYQVSPAIQELCRRSHGFIFVVDTSKTTEEISNSQTELFAMLCELWSSVGAPLLVLAACQQTETPSTEFTPPTDVVKALRLGRLNRKWIVQQGDVNSLNGIREGFQWALSQIGYSTMLAASLRPSR